MKITKGSMTRVAIVLVGTATFLALGCSKIDRSNEHLDAMEQSTKKMAEELENYKQDVARMSKAMENLEAVSRMTQAIERLALQAERASTKFASAMDAIFPETPPPPAQMPTVADVLNSLPGDDTASAQGGAR